MKTKRIVLLLAVLVVFAVAMTSCGFLSQYHEHVWEGGSCTEPRTCSVCHAVEEEVLGHAEESVLGYAATCTEEGLSDGTVCSICGTVVVAQEVIPALGHDIIADAAVDATCTEAGLTAGEHCSRCDGATVAQETIPALGHDIAKDVAKAPTCTEAGLTEGEHCTRCDGATVAQETVAALGHDMIIDAAKAPTCTEAGLKEGSHCSRCDHKVAQEVDPALGHNIVKDEAKAPTCTETGLTAGEHCSRCDGATVAQQTVAALGHKYENCVCTVCQAVIPALDVTDSFDFTTADGLSAALASGKLGYTGTFRNNGDSHQFAADSSIQFVVPANTTVTITGHSTGYGVFDVYLNGVKTDMAGVLSFTVTEETKVVILPDEEATYSKAYLKSIALEKFVDRTIVEDTTITFGSEGNYKDSIVDFSGIQIGDNGGNNSQVKNGSFDLLLKAGSKVVIHGYPKYTSYKLNDGDEITAEWYTYIALTDTVLTVTPVNGNNYFYSIEITLHNGVAQVEAKPADCENAGYEAYYSCTCHGELTTKVVVDALGHTEETLAGKAATCTETGLTAGKKCSVCQKVLVAQTEIAAKGHTEEALAAKDATCTEAGLTAGKKCSVCGEILVAQEEIPMLAHIFVNGICACGHKDPNYVDYHLVGYINGKDYGCEADYKNPGEYKFVDGKLVAKFNNDSYIFIKTVNLNGESVKWYLFETYHDASKTEGILYENKSEKMFVPGNVEVEFTLTVNDDGSLKLALEYHVHSYSEPTCTEPGKCSCGLTQGEATGHVWADATFDAPKTCSKCGATEGTALVAVATADGKKYQTLAEALEGGSEIVLLANIELDAPIVINGNYTIDLNGYSLSYTSQVMGEAMITNNGTLVINDSAVNGVINYNYVGTNDASYGKGNYTISNRGHLTINGGKITIANLRQHAKYPIDNNSGSSDAVLVINGGHLYNYNTSAIRMICSASHKNSVTVNGGLVEGYCAIWIQNPGKNTVNGDLTITGGEIRTTAAAYVNGTAALKDVSSSIYCTIAADGGAWSESSFINISGGIFNENVELLEDAPVTTITAGTFNGRVEHAHNYVGASCTADGTCGCGAVGGKLSHTEQTVAGKAPTCDNAGLTDGKKCSVCGETLVAQEEIPAKGHAYETIYVWAADNSYYIEKQVCKNDASHVIEGATVTVSHIDLHVTASKVTYTYHAGEQTKTVESDLALENKIATINAPAVEGRVASHDYVKYGFHDAAATYEFTIYYSEVDVWDGTVATEFAGGTGTEEDPYIIMTGAQLAYLAKLGKDNTAAKNDVYGTGIYYKLGASLDLSGHQWTPIAMYDKGYAWTYFDGNFDGANHKIIFNIETTSYGYGLFLGLGPKSVVKDLTLYGSVTTAHRAGALAYISLPGATVNNVANYASVTGTATGGYVGGLFGSTSGAIINDCVNYGTITSAGTQVGGIVGAALASTNTNSCVNFGHIIGTAGSAGGIYGTSNASTVNNSVNYGTIDSTGTAAGIIGNVTTQSSIYSSVNYGTINASSWNVGGIGGYLGEGGKISDSVNHGTITNTGNNTGGIIGQNKGGTVSNCDNYGTITGVEKIGGIAGESTAAITGCANYGNVVGTKCSTNTLNQITFSDVTKTDCVENGKIIINHNLTHVDAKAATCENAGNVAYDNCSVCGKNLDAEGKELASVEVAALGHTDEVVLGKAPTCTESGLTEGKKCSVCGMTLVAQKEIPAGHKDDNDDGKCDVCGIDICNHVTETVIENEKAATCTEAGSYDSVVKCTACGKELSRDAVTVNALGHAYDAPVYVWADDNSSCTENKVCKNDASHVFSATETVSKVELNVTASKVTYTYHAGEQTKTVESDLALENNIATINAPAIAGRVASHDYVKFGFHDAAATYEFTIHYSEVDVWDGTSVSESLAGSGTEEDPYLIQSAADLAYIAKVVNTAAKGTTNFKGQYFKMTKSIDLGGKELKIGGYTAGTEFHGFFDGNNCSVRGINATQSLFGMLKNGYIKNLSTYGKVTTTEKKGVAGLVSYISNATVENATNYVDVTGVQQVAGVVGYLESNTTTLAKNCVNYGTVTGTSYQVGGIAGFAKGSFSGCTNFGDVTSTGSGYVGGIGGAAKDAKGTRSDCVNYGNISGTDYVGGCFGQITATTTNCYGYGTAKTVTTGKNIGEVVGSGATYLTYTE